LSYSVDVNAELLVVTTESQRFKMAAAPGKKPPAPGEKTQEEIEEEMAAERELADDAQWKIIQKNTFTRWANEHLKTAKLVVVDLEKDLSDGLRLIGLIEVLSGKKFAKYNKKPTFRTQKFENVTQSLRFLEEKEGIKIVNIGLMFPFTLCISINAYTAN